MIRSLLFYFFVFAGNTLFAQGLAVNTTGTAANNSSMLDVSSTAKGALMPRMTTAERNAIVTPATGLLVYNTTTNEFNFYDGTAWQAWNSNWVRNGNHLYNRNQATGGVTVGSNAVPTASLDVHRNASLTGGTALIRGTTHNSVFNTGGFQDTYIRGGIDDGYVILNDIPGGRVGVGTALPLAKFHVFNGASGVGVNIASLLVENNNNNYISISNPAVNEGGLLFGLPANVADGGIIYNNSGLPGGLQFRTNGNTTRMTLSNAGNLGVGITNAATYPLDVNGRARMRYNGNSAGIWFNESTNANVRGFVGMRTDNSVGLWGNNGAGWALTINTQSGAVEVQTNPGTTGQVLTSSGAGAPAAWRDQAIANVVGVLPTEFGVNVTAATNVFLQTGAYIDLPPGRYAVNATMLLTLTNNTITIINGTNASFWVRSTFSESAGVNPVQSPDIQGAYLISGNLAPSSYYGLMSGAIIINNTTAATKRYYYVAGIANTVNQLATAACTYIGGYYWDENSIIAYRIQ